MKGTLVWRVSKIETKVSRHHGLHQEYDGAIGWNSLLPRLRRDFGKEGAGSFSISQRLEEATKRDFRIVWVRMVISPTYVSSKVTQEEQWLTLHYWTMFKFHFGWRESASTSDVPEQCIPSHKQDLSRVEKTPLKHCLLCSSGPHEQRTKVPRIKGTTKGTQQKQVDSDPGRNLLDQPEKGATILYQRHPAPRPPPQIVLKEAWRVQRDEVSQRRTGIEISIAEQEDKFKIDFRVQGVPHQAVLEDEGRTNRIQTLAHIL